ncbi:hypothetical protein [Aliarcobacter butzleri]|uniref:hypothetical protein n=1 Tax=Aliarcobacter butzleri TaxID=28197 RepID=UPI002B245C90|nr:hypothetical protein [Aliarcobacter butzleri]
MELVYLWVEDYKNIKKQGFNFSPRFRCEFKDEYEKYIDTDGKEKEKLKDNCELIIEKKEYKSIFPDNINITAIVGENRSGKSSLLESLFKNREDLLRLITGGYIDDTDINKRPLSKLIKDISEELELI